jgi:hypothetical protein
MKCKLIQVKAKLAKTENDKRLRNKLNDFEERKSEDLKNEVTGKNNKIIKNLKKTISMAKGCLLVNN